MIDTDSTKEEVLAAVKQWGGVRCRMRVRHCVEIVRW
jgi:hypothetical protein